MIKKENLPNEVLVAVKLLLMVIVIGIISSIFNFSSSLEIANNYGLGLGWLIFTTCFSFLFFGFFIWKIWQGKNWARITYLVLFILGIPTTIYNYLTLKMNYPSIIIGLIGMIIQIIALILLFKRSSSEWFNRKN